MPSLIKRIRLAKKGYSESSEALLALEQSLSRSVDLNQWRLEESIAVKERGDKLRIFEVQFQHGSTVNSLMNVYD